MSADRQEPRRAAPRRTDTPGLTARRLAIELLGSVLDQGRMMDDAAQGSGAERAEAKGLADLCLRRLGQIDAVLNQFVQRPPKGAGRTILRLMAAELLFAGTAPHAAVDIAVRLTQIVPGTRRLSGLVNAVGRKLAAQGGHIVADQDAVALNMPGALRHRLVQDWGRDVTNRVAQTQMDAPPHDLSLRHTGDVEALAAETGGTVLPTGTLRLPGRPQISALPGFAEGAWWVQDAAASLPASLLPSTGKVLDLCAAPGGKTMQLAAAGADVTAVDVSDRRMERVQENLSRTGLVANCITADILDWSPDGPCDAILLDAPCSATGTIRRHPDLPHRLNLRGIGALIDLQTQMIDRAFDWLAPGGILVWCTCSLLRAEGEDQARAFLDRTPDAEPVPITPDEVPEVFITDGMLRTRPDHWEEFGGLDGFFAQRVRRRP